MSGTPTPKLDTSRVPRGEIAARALVDAVVASDDRVERHYLEAKSDLDLATKRDQAKLAKFILGAANRMPDRAEKAFEGYAVMVIGAATGALIGVPPIETLTIERAVLPYIEADGPKWDLLRVAVPNSENEVLLLVVDPPQWGQDPFICHKEGDGLLDGVVYVRADGETRQAKAGELRALIRRGGSSAPSVDFEVALNGDVVRATVDHERALEDYLVAERKRLILAMPSDYRPSDYQLEPVEVSGDSAITLGGLLGTTPKFAAAFGTQPETRTKEEYLAAIDSWEQSLRGAWLETALRLVILNLEPVEIRLTNREQTFFHDVELKVHLEGDVQGIECEDLEEAVSIADLSLPSPPREWGPVPFNFGMSVPDFGQPLGYRSIIPNRVEWHNTGSVDITFSVGDLRPMQTDACDDGDFALLLLGGAEDHVRGTWEITARGHHKVYSGELRVPVADRDFTAVFRHVLGLSD